MINIYVGEFVTGAVFGFEFVDDRLLWVLHLGFFRIMKFRKEALEDVE